MNSLNSGRNSIIKAANLLRDKERGYDPVLLTQTLASLDEAAVVVRNNVQSYDTLLWTKYHCYFRLDRMEEAASTLYEIWDSIEEIRSRMKDPKSRAGMLRQFPKLFRALTQTMYRSGRSLDMLAAIEAGRGRFLSEAVLTDNRMDARTSFSFLAKQIVALMQREQSHFLSFMPDEKESYAVLVTRKGAVHTAELPITDSDIRSLMPYIAPHTWGKKKSLRGARNPNVSEALAPLVNWLEPYFEWWRSSQKGITFVTHRVEYYSFSPCSTLPGRVAIWVQPSRCRES